MGHIRGQRMRSIVKIMRKLENIRWSWLCLIMFLQARIDLSSPEIEISSDYSIFTSKMGERQESIISNYRLGSICNSSMKWSHSVCVHVFLCVFVCLLERILMGGVACTAMIMTFVMSTRSVNMRETAMQKLNCVWWSVCCAIYVCVWMFVLCMLDQYVHWPTYNRWDGNRFLPIHGAEWK